MTTPQSVPGLAALLTASLVLASSLPATATEQQEAQQKNISDSRYHIYVSGIT